MPLLGLLAARAHRLAGKFAPIPWLYADIVRHLAWQERVRILVQNIDERQQARRVLERSGADLGAVDFSSFHQSWLDTRLRPDIIRRNGTRTKGRASKAGVAITNWHFNAWAKYDDCTKTIPQHGASRQN